MNLYEKIKLNLENMSKSEQKAAAHYFKSQEDFAFDTLNIVAEKIGISTTSVIRFCYKSGFDGYKEFQDSVRESIKFSKTLPDKFELTMDSANNQGAFSKIINNAFYCIEKTFNNLSESAVDNAVEEIKNANRVFCFGMKESYCLAHYTYTRLLTVRNNVFMLSAGQNGEIESLFNLNENDICIFFIFHRYTRLSVQILETLKKQRIKVVLITSSPMEEIEGCAKYLFDCKVNIEGIKNSYVAPITLVDTLSNLLVIKSGEKALKYMQNCESLFKEFTF